MTTAVALRSAVMVLFAAGLAGAAVAQQVTIHEPASIEFRADARMPGVSVAIVAGDPRLGAYTMRVKFAPNVTVPPHRHPDERTLTVLSGTYRFAAGDHFDAALLRPYVAGTVIIVPAGLAHFVASGDEPVVLQESGTGPTGTEIVGGP